MRKGRSWIGPSAAALALCALSACGTGAALPTAGADVCSCLFVEECSDGAVDLGDSAGSAAPDVDAGPAGFVRIEPGTFVMGSPPDEPGRHSLERQRTVTISRAFWLGSREVTIAEWEEVMGPRPAAFAAPPGEPVMFLSWSDATALANARSRREGLEECFVDHRFTSVACLGYRLPTEAEWEYAARAGSTAATLEPQWAYAWYRPNATLILHPGGKKSPNAWGLYDMLGNVREPCIDDNLPYQTKTPHIDPVVVGDKLSKISRGGDITTEGLSLRFALREHASFDSTWWTLGVRLARTIPPGE